MQSSRKENLEVTPFSDLSLRKSSIRSLDGFRSPSPLPSSQGLLSGKQNVLYELAKLIQTDGTKAAILGDLQRVKEIVQDIKKHSCDHLIDLTTEEDGYNMLHFAVCYKRAEIVKYLIENGANAECTTKADENDTPLMLAIRYYDSFTAKHLEEATTLKRGETSTGIVSLLLTYANINAHNASGTTPLALAVQKQNESIIELLLENPNIMINKQNLQGYSPLHFACAGENIDIIVMLLEKGANMFCKTDKGYIPFHIACRKGNVEALELLIQKCPEEDTTPLTLSKAKKKKKKKNKAEKQDHVKGKAKLFEAKDNYGNTALLLAKEAPNSTVFDVLQTKYNLDIHTKNNNGDGIFHKFAKDDDGVLNAELLKRDECVSMLKEGNLKRDTPLHIACQLGHWKNIGLFIEKGASISVTNAAGNNPLMTAIIAGNIEVLLHMLRAINEFEKMSFRDILSLNAKNNKTILTWAIESNHIVLIETIMELDLHLVTEGDPDSGKALIHIAAASGALSIIKVLLNKTHILELLHLTDGNGRTALMLAAQNGHLDCVKALHLHDGNIDGNESELEMLNAADNNDRTALHLACLNGHFQIVSYLCSSGANLEASEGDYGTPLACAASNGHVNIVNYLLGQNMDVNAGIKTTPLILASKNGHEKCVKLLLQQPHVDVTIQDEDGYNCLAFAALNRHLEASLAIINSPHWQEALKGYAKDSSTPLRLLIKHLPDAAEVVLFRCIDQIQNDRGEVTAIEMCFEFLDDFQDPIKGGIYGVVHTLFVNPDAEDETSEIQVISGRVQKSGPVSPVKFNKSNHILQWMVKYERTRLLQHPVTRELVSYKWKAYAMPAFIINLAIYFTFVVFLTMFALVSPLPTEPLCRRDEDDCTNDPDFSQVFLRFAATVLLGYCAVRAVLELLQMLQRRLNYLMDPENYLELLLIFSTFTFATAGQSEGCFCLGSNTWQFGALAVFLAWIDLVLYLKKLPLTAIPINMLQSIIWTFLKLIYLPFILLIAFALPFYMLFSRPEFQNVFDTPGFSLMKTFVMTAGEFDYETVFRFRELPDDNNGTMTESPTSVDLNYFVMSCVLWVIFVILMPVLFANLLIGLAVGDTQKVEEKATLTYLSLLVNLALEMEEKLPWIRRRLKKTSYRVEKNPKVPWYLFWYQKLTNIIFRNTFQELEQNVNELLSEDKLSSLLQGLEVLEPIDDVKVQVQTNTVTMKQIKDMLTKQSSEATEINKKIENILAVIEDLRKVVENKTAPEASFDGHHPKPNINEHNHNTTPHKSFVVKIEEFPTIQHET